MGTIRIGGKPNNVDVQHNISKQGLANLKEAKRRRKILYISIAIITILVAGALYVTI